MIKKSTINWLRQTTSRLVHGELTEKGVRPNITKNKLLVNNKLRPRKMPLNKILSHINNEKTMYFCGNGKTKDPFTLVMIDIDVQKNKKIGSYKGAEEFRNHIKSIFPNIFFEKSTNGKGIHGYFLLEKQGYSAKEVNKTIEKFEGWLKKEKQKNNFDVEEIEIKGKCPEIIFKNNIIKNIKYGTLAKIPRDLDPIPKSQKIKIEEINNFYSYEEKTNKQSGSVSNKLFSERDLKLIKKYEYLFHEIVGQEKLKANNHKVNKHDFAIALFILKFFKENPNSDKSLPTERAKNLWISLFNNKDVKRNWNHHRWKAIRDFLSKKGLINWVSNKYKYTTKFSPGFSCKWEISQNFFRYIQNKTRSTDKRASLMDSLDINKDKENRFIENLGYYIPKLSILNENDYEYVMKMSLNLSEYICYT